LNDLLESIAARADGVRDIIIIPSVAVIINAPRRDVDVVVVVVVVSAGVSSLSRTARTIGIDARRIVVGFPRAAVAVFKTIVVVVVMVVVIAWCMVHASVCVGGLHSMRVESTTFSTCDDVDTKLHHGKKVKKISSRKMVLTHPPWAWL
jgi:hypothetical protein